MDSIMEISKLALGNERLKAEIASINIARANTPISPERIETLNFSSLINEPPEINKSLFFKGSNSVKYLYEPDSSYANEKGFVAYHNIDIASEFVKMTLSKRAYEANVRIFNTAAKMHVKSLEIGRV